ncbi:hypothetical protein ASF36_13765 [Methylobacterium sp. Leaf90]|nr:hypothetical protein ASF36_13765 [Methylobacterium sp. Leaf90]
MPDSSPAVDELFEAKVVRIDWCGVMVAGGHKAVGIEPNRILFGNVSGCRNAPGTPVKISLCTPYICNV